MLRNVLLNMFNSVGLYGEHAKCHILSNMLRKRLLRNILRLVYDWFLDTELMLD